QKLGASLHGMALTKDGSRLYVTAAQSVILEIDVAGDGMVSLGRTIEIRVKKQGQSYPNGIALSPDERTAYVCLSCNNSLAAVDLASGKITANIPVGAAPYAVAVSPDGATAYVSDWGGRRARAGDKTSTSAGTAIVVDDRGIASTGCLSIVDLATHREIAQVPTGLHPSDVQLSRDGRTVYVANANSDTVSAIDTAGRTVTGTLAVRPDANLPFGSSPNALALSEDGQTLYVANGGNNAVAVVNLAHPQRPAEFIPAAWFPGALALRNGRLFIANVKGVGSLDPAQKSKFPTRYRKLGIGQLFPSSTGRCRAGGLYEAGDRRRDGAASAQCLRARSGQPARRSASRPRRRAVAVQACHLHHQGKPHVRSGAGGHRPGQLRPRPLYLRP